MRREALGIVRLAIGLLMIVFGLHQVKQPRAWLHYLPYWFRKLIPMSEVTFMREHGAGNFSLGIMFLLNIKPKILYWIVLAWWLTILPFVFYDDWRDGLRDVVTIATIISLVGAMAHRGRAAVMREF